MSKLHSAHFFASHHKAGKKNQACGLLCLFGIVQLQKVKVTHDKNNYRFQHLGDNHCDSFEENIIKKYEKKKLQLKQN